MIKLAADSVTNFTAAPLRVATWLGLLSFFFCMLMFVYVAISYALDDTVRGWPSVIATVLFLGGAQLLSLGLLGEYLGRLYAAVQGRPTYFVGYDSAESSPLDKVTPAPSRRRSRLAGRRGLLLSQLPGRIMGRRGGHGPHPLPQRALLVQEVADVVLGVLELGRPEQRVERAGLDADAAVHAQREVDREPVEDVALAGPGRAGNDDLLLVRVDVDAPVGALPGAQHADRAVLLEQPDHAPRARWQVGLYVRVLPGVGPPGHRLQRDREALREPLAHPTTGHTHILPPLRRTSHLTARIMSPRVWWDSMRDPKAPDMTAALSEAPPSSTSTSRGRSDCRSSRSRRRS
jgi:hypothetical protein